eukprot:1953259-Prymnesium_polylepis.1
MKSIDRQRKGSRTVHFSHESYGHCDFRDFGNGRRNEIRDFISCNLRIGCTAGRSGQDCAGQDCAGQDSQLPERPSVRPERVKP